MKVYLYSQWRKLIKKSGVGRAAYHQRQALQNQDVERYQEKRKRMLYI